LDFLGIDIGFGTTDILVISEGKIYKMVLPTRGQQLAKQVRNYQGDVYIEGIEMGGNPLSEALKGKIKEGFDVFITHKAAATINYNFKKLQERGFTLISENEFKSANKNKALTIHTADFLPDRLNNFLEGQNISTNFDIVAVAVQDHGKTKKSSTEFRGIWIQEQLKKMPYLDSFLFSETQIPPYLIRMKEIHNHFKSFYPESRFYVMDTVFAAIQGAIYSQTTSANIISMDIGNGHTAAVSLASEEICGYFEFHTSAITPTKLEWAINKLIKGNLSNEEIWKEEGHGALTRKPISVPYNIFVTGPHRRLITETNLEYYFANPLGDMMITGCVGLAHGIEIREKIDLLFPF